MKIKDIDKLTNEAVREYLKELMEKLDDLDEDDFFGTEGWRHYILGED